MTNPIPAYAPPQMMTPAEMMAAAQRQMQQSTAPTPQVAATATPVAAAAPAPRAGWTRFPLRRPIADEAGQRLTHIDLAEPTLGHKISMQQSKATDGVAGTIEAIAAMSGLPAVVIERLIPADAGIIGDWIAERMAVEPITDVDADGNPIDIPIPTDTERLITLKHPVTLGTQTLTQITIQAPTLGAAVGISARKTEAEQTAWFIHKLSGVNLMLVNRLAMVDVAQIEAFTAPFSYRPRPQATATSQAAMAATGRR